MRISIQLCHNMIDFSRKCLLFIFIDFSRECLLFIFIFDN